MTLYEVVIDKICGDYDKLQGGVEELPDPVLCDVYYKMSTLDSDGRGVGEVLKSLSNIKTFLRLLKLKAGDLDKVVYIFKAASTVFLTKLVVSVADAYCRSCPQLSAKEYNGGMQIGEFLMLCGWSKEAARVYQHYYTFMYKDDSQESLKNQLNCLEKLLVAQSNYYMIEECAETVEIVEGLLEKLEMEAKDDVQVKIYNAFSIHYFNQNRYDEALKWSLKSLSELQNRGKSNGVLFVDVLRQASVCCSVKRELVKSKLLITSAMKLARNKLGSVKLAECLMDLAFYYLSSDNAPKAVEMYQEAATIRAAAFGANNILTAVTLSQLSYSLYVKEYSTGKFGSAKDCILKASEAFEKILPKDHLLMTLAKRVWALIAEEIAIDNSGTPIEAKYLFEAEKLHISCVYITTNVLGEANVHSAKHYGNLGRLYQTMKKYGEAEEMHLKAIHIKEAILGEWDYEVALSLGHLASLYNYDLLQFNKAEELYIRSIKIGKKLFGDAYSGLEYDYRGLIQLYLMTEQQEKLEEYTRILSGWQALQGGRNKEANVVLDINLDDEHNSHSINGVIEEFFSIDWHHWTNSS